MRAHQVSVNIAKCSENIKKNGGYALIPIQPREVVDFFGTSLFGFDTWWVLIYLPAWLYCGAFSS